MSIIHQSIVVVVGGALPGQNNLVIVANVTEDHRVFRIHLGGIGDADSAIGVTGIDHGGICIDSLGGIDLSQTLCGHLDGHNTFTCGGGVIGNGELTVSFLPGSNLIGAGCIGEELQNNVTLGVGQTLGQGIHKGVAGQVGGFGGNGGQSRDDLVVQNVTCRSGAGVGITVGDVGSGTVVLAGIVLVLTQGLFQSGDAGQVLGIQGDIIDPGSAAVISIGAVNSGHGDRYQEGVGSGGDHFGNLGFNQQVQAQVQILGFGLAVGVSQRHSHAAVCSHVCFQSILDGGGVGFQTCSQSIDQNVRLVEVLVCIQMVSVGVALVTVFQAQSLQEVSTLNLVDTIQSFNMVVGTGVSFGLGELDDISDLQVAELNALDGIAVADFTIAQVGLGGTTQNVVDTSFIIDTGGDIGAVPHAVLLSVGQVILVNGQTAFGFFVDENAFTRVISVISGCRSGYRERQAQSQCQQQRHDLLKIFHFALSFLK